MPTPLFLPRRGPDASGAAPPRALTGASGRGREAAALLLAATAAFAALALASFEANPARPEAHGPDWVGPVGASLASALAGTLGVVAWAVVLELALLAWPLLRARSSSATLARLAGDVLIALIAAALVHVAAPDARAFGALAAGGSLGELFGELLRSLFSTLGSFLVGLTAVGLILIGRSSLSLTAWLEEARRFVTRAAHWLVTYLRALSAWVRQWAATPVEVGATATGPATPLSDRSPPTWAREGTWGRDASTPPAGDAALKASSAPPVQPASGNPAEAAPPRRSRARARSDEPEPQPAAPAAAPAAPSPVLTAAPAAPSPVLAAVPRAGRARAALAAAPDADESRPATDDRPPPVPVIHSGEDLAAAASSAPPGRTLPSVAVGPRITHGPMHAPKPLAEPTPETPTADPPAPLRRDRDLETPLPDAGRAGAPKGSAATAERRSPPASAPERKAMPSPALEPKPQAAPALEPRPQTAPLAEPRPQASPAIERRSLASSPPDRKPTATLAERGVEATSVERKALPAPRAKRDEKADEGALSPFGEADDASDALFERGDTPSLGSERGSNSAQPSPRQAAPAASAERGGGAAPGRANAGSGGRRDLGEVEAHADEHHDASEGEAAQGAASGAARARPVAARRPAPEPRLPETKAAEAKAQDARLPGARAPEAKAFEARAPETKASDERPLETRAPEARLPEAKASEAKLPGARLSDARLADARVADPRFADAKEPEARGREARPAASEARAPEARAPESRAPEARAAEVRAPEPRAADLRAPEPRAADLRAPEPRAADLRAPDARLAEVRAPEPRAAEARAPEPRAAEARAPEIKAPEVKAPAARAPERAVVVPAFGQGFRLPGPALLEPPPATTPREEPEALLARARELEKVLANYGVKGAVADIHTGPTVSTFEVIPAEGTKVSKVASLVDDLALGLSCTVRIIAPIPGKSRIGFELPNRERIPVNLRELVEDRRFRDMGAPLPVVLGRDIVGSPFYADLASMPHVIVAGATGAGKSVGLNVMLTSLLTRRGPDELRMLMIDPKVVELAPFDRIPHMLLPVVTDMKQASTALKWAVDEMERRYQLFAHAGTKNIGTYNAWVARARRGEVKAYRPPQPASSMTTDDGVFVEVGPGREPPPPPEPLPFIVIVVDEFADLMMQQGKDVEAAVARLAQKARAAGMHVILATQRPSVDVITGMIKANFPTRVAFRVAQRVDSRTILDEQGAEHLLGRGDMLVKLNGTNETRRVQCPFISEEEVQRVTDFLRAQGEPVYDENILKPRDDDEGGAASDDDGELDPRYDDAVRIVAETRRCSTSWLQRKLGLGYNRAAKIVEAMEKRGLVGPAHGARDREVLIDPL
ncbi:MAG TPA: DNA translocase FtsK 4TM domain-containing protein [Polyangiaceae bacterium]|nr:DNA translocase FtsK 4TM domain-containing protein [Polyangiaceae bacterium]